MPNRKIIGIQALYSSAEFNLPIPEFDHYLVSICMRGLVICCTSVPPEQRVCPLVHFTGTVLDSAPKDVIYQRVLCMGGSVSKHLINSVTHLVANATNSQKYKVRLH